jgi:hypothetical protein
MSAVRFVCLLGIAVLAVACESAARAPLATEPDYQPLALRRPDRGFRLSPGERARVVPGFDVAALERLLGMVRPDMRARVLWYFQAGGPGEPGRGALTSFTEPALQAVLEEVWAPMWDAVPDRELDADSSYFPGRGIARQRRQLARTAQGTGGE